jgi:hypothetical protein
MRIAKHLLALATMIAVAAPMASAQTRTHHGLWVNAGLGAGSLGCDGCDGRETGLSGGFALGTAVNQKLSVGVGTNSWRKSEDGVSLLLSAVTVMARFYPSETGHFFLQGGAGLGMARASLSGFGSDTETGSAAMLGVGYDFRIANNVSLTPFWNGVATRINDVDTNFGQLGLGLTLH